MDEQIKVLVVEDKEDDFVITRTLLTGIEETDYLIDWVRSYNDGLVALHKSAHDVCLLDYQLGTRNGLEFLYEAVTNDCEIPIILLTDEGDYDIDVEAAKLGASDYMVKGQISPAMLERTIRYSIERKKIEETRDTAIDAARLKSEFLANMSHEIRTPMTGIIGMLDMLMDTKLDEKQIEFAETIRMSTNSLMGIIDDILDFSKIEAGKLRFEEIDFDLQANIEYVTDLFAERAHSKEIKIESFIGCDVPTALIGDPGRLRQVLTNLLGNAVKFTNKGEIKTHVTKADENDETVTLNFAISDTGIGIDKEAQAILFQPFIQADGSTTRRFGGSGLGLSISKQLVEMMNGEISVESVPDEGSTFTFSARFGKQTLTETDVVVPLDDLANLRVLIVDEDKTNRKILSDQTSSWGMSATEAAEGDVALAMMEEASANGQPFDLLILDRQMSGTDGFEFVRSVKKNPQLANTKIILIPTYGKRGDGRIADKVGIDGYLVKPIRQSDLFDCIANIMCEDYLNAATDIKGINLKHKLVTKHLINEKRAKQNIRILLAEDNRINQKVTKAQVERLGYEIDIVENGLEAVQALQQKSYSMVLMDCQMPKMDGYEATAEIRQNGKEAKNVPIIALTANALTGERETCLAAGMSDYLAKPFKQAELVRVINRWSQQGDLENDIEPANADNPDESSQRDKPGENILTRAEELLSSVGEDAFEALTASFLENTTERLHLIRQLIAEYRVAKVKPEAHLLRSSFDNIGAKSTAAKCFKLEQGCEELGTAELNRILDEIESDFLQISEVFEPEKIGSS